MFDRQQNTTVSPSGKQRLRHRIPFVPRIGVATLLLGMALVVGITSTTLAAPAGIFTSLSGRSMRGLPVPSYCLASGSATAFPTPFVVQPTPISAPASAEIPIEDNRHVTLGYVQLRTCGDLYFGQVIALEGSQTMSASISDGFDSIPGQMVIRASVLSDGVPISTTNAVCVMGTILENNSPFTATACNTTAPDNADGAGGSF